MNIKKITGKEVKDAVEWLWSNRKNGGCYHKVVWTEPDWIEDESPTEYNIAPNPHAGREWCICIGWTDYGNERDANEPGFYCDGRYRIRGAIRYQNRNNAMHCDLDLDFTIPGPCNEEGDLYDLSFDIPKVKNGMEGWNNTAGDLNEYAEEMFDFWKTDWEKIA